MIKDNTNNEVVATKRVEIWNRRAFEAVAPRLLSTTARAEAFSVLNIESADNATLICRAFASKAQVGLETPYLEATVGTAITHVTPSFQDRVNRFSRAYIEVRPNAALRSCIKKGLLWVATTVDENNFEVEEVILVGESEGNGISRFYDLVRGRYYPAAKLLARADMRWYRYSTVGSSSPGQEKAGKITLYCVGGLEGFDAGHHMDVMTHGAYTFAVKKYKDVSLGKRKLQAQLATRMSQYKASMVKTGPIRAIAICACKWQDTIGNEFADGIQFFNSYGLAEAISNDRFHVQPQAIEGAVFQARPLIVNKGLGMVVSPATIAELIRSLKGKLVILAQDTMSENDFDAYRDMAYERKGRFCTLSEEDKAAGYAMKVVVIVPTLRASNGGRKSEEDVLREIDVFCDLNVHKTACDIKGRALGGFNLMTKNHEREVEDAAKSSTQLLASLLAADLVKTRDLYVENAKAEATAIADEIVNVESKQLSAKDLKGDLSQTVIKFSPEFVRENWSPWYQDRINKRLEGMANRLNKMQIKIDGLYCKIIPDFSRFFGESLLGHDSKSGKTEVFVPGLVEEGFDHGIGIKYPKMCFQEYGDFVFIAEDEMHRRVSNLRKEEKINGAQEAAIKDVLSHLQKGIIMVPAIEKLKNMLAGMDFDGDGLVLYLEEEINQIMAQLKPLAVVINS